MKLKELIASVRPMLAKLANHGGTLLVVKPMRGRPTGVYMNERDNVSADFEQAEFDYAEDQGLVTRSKNQSGSDLYKITAKGRAFAEELTSDESLLQAASSINNSMNVKVDKFHGVINTGSMHNVGSISIHTDSSEAGIELSELTAALAKLLNVVKDDTSLSKADRDEAVERLDYVSKAIVQSADQRPPQFLLKDTVKQFPEIIKTSASCMTAWHYAAPLLNSFLGIN